MISSLIISFYRFWHGTLHLKGAGLLLRLLLPFCAGLHSFRLKLPEGHSVMVDFRDVSAMYWLNHLLGDRFEEEGLLASVISHTNEKYIVWDVGANCGLFSYRLSKESKAEEVVFFEPNPAMYSLATAACAPRKNVIGLNFALSDRAQRASLIIPRESSTMGTLEVERTSRTGITAAVECKTGDELVESGMLKAPQIIKIDTEGHEPAVIRGLTNIITKYTPIIFFEHISMSDEEALRIVPARYELYSVSDHDGALTLGFNRAKGHNSALIPKHK